MEERREAHMGKVSNRAYPRSKVAYTSSSLWTPNLSSCSFGHEWAIMRRVWPVILMHPVMSSACGFIHTSSVERRMSHEHPYIHRVWNDV